MNNTISTPLPSKRIFNPFFLIIGGTVDLFTKHSLMDLCESHTIEELEKKYLNDATTVLSLFILHMMTKPARTDSVGSTTKSFLLKMFAWIAAHENDFWETYWSIFDRLYPELQPLTYLKKARVYNLDDWAATFGLEPKDIIAEEYNAFGIEFSPKGMLRKEV